MEKNRDKERLNDSLMDMVSGGYEETGSSEVTGGMIEICRYCGRPIRNGNIEDHAQDCYGVRTR